ncbi:hypothetical protein [Nocardia farcinica]|uniref:hypothetical protein n=1 Tax=Nocardia farcinica TaxID=37329 RepID=UPI00245628EF|nr:hypothetical protein [Nocardia farcinica]
MEIQRDSLRDGIGAGAPRAPALVPGDLDGFVRARSIFYGRNCLDRERWRAAGWVYAGLGTP